MLVTLFFIRERSRQFADDVIGPLKVKIISAQLTRDTEMIGKMDPYVEFKIGGQKVYKTAVLDEAGKTPQWNEEFDYEVKDMSLEVNFVVSDEDWGTDDIVGEGTISLADLCKEGGTDQSWPIAFKGEDAGTVRIASTFVDFNAAKRILEDEEQERLR